MASAEEIKASKIRSPNDIGRTANDFGVLKFTGTTSSQANALPQAWKGRWVIIYCSGGNTHFAFSTSASAAVNDGVAATAAGASSQVGGVVADGLANKEHRRLPDWSANDTLYFVRKCSASCDIYIELGDQ